MIDEDTHQGIVAYLNNPAGFTRLATSGGIRARASTGAAYVVTARDFIGGKDKPRAYACRERHVRRQGEALDSYINAIIIGRLSQPDAANDQCVAPLTVDVGRLHYPESRPTGAPGRTRRPLRRRQHQRRPTKTRHRRTGQRRRPMWTLSCGRHTREPRRGIHRKGARRCPIRAAMDRIIAGYPRQDHRPTNHGHRQPITTRTEAFRSRIRRGEVEAQWVAAVSIGT